MSKTDCDDQCECGCKRRKFLCRALGCTAALLVVVAILALAGWFLLLPSKPQFSLQEVDVHDFNVDQRSQQGFVTSFLEPTILTRNHNRGVAIHYDQIRAFVSYRNQRITTPAYAAPMYQDRGAAAAWTPYLVGNRVPMEMQRFGPLWNDLASKDLVLDVKFEARIRWRIGPWKSGHHDLRVTCPAVLEFPGRGHIRLQQASACSVVV